MDFKLYLLILALHPDVGLNLNRSETSHGIQAKLFDLEAYNYTNYYKLLQT